MLDRSVNNCEFLAVFKSQLSVTDIFQMNFFYLFKNYENYDIVNNSF